MILKEYIQELGINRVPRVGGGDPANFAEFMEEWQCSPRRRG